MQVQRKFRSDSVHVAPLETAEIITVEMIPYCVTRDQGLPCLGVVGGLDLGVGLAGCRFLLCR